MHVQAPTPDNNAVIDQELRRELARLESELDQLEMDVQIHHVHVKNLERRREQKLLCGELGQVKEIDQSIAAHEAKVQDIELRADDLLEASERLQAMVEGWGAQ